MHSSSSSTLEKVDATGEYSQLYFGKYQVEKTLGQGAFGKVKLATDKDTNSKVALKIIQKCRITKLTQITRIKREIAIMRLLCHPHIGRLFDVEENEKEIVLSMEYIKGGELFDYILAKKKLNEVDGRKFFRQIVSAIDFCHGNHIVHRGSVN